jgi:choline dehydrogenase-like flavoprotein
MTTTGQPDPTFEPEFIVVGSGAGGGTVAARLAEEGFRVLVLEAGGDPGKLSGANPISNGANAMPTDYEVPAFHPFATENDALKWDFFVRHYTDEKQQALDPHYCAEYQGQPVKGVWYPRAGTLGGCTSHNALIFVAPNDADWNFIADLTGDASWRADRMHAYFEKVENCQYRPLVRLFEWLGGGVAKRNTKGWLTTDVFDPGNAVRDHALLRTILESARSSVKAVAEATGTRSDAGLRDPNDRTIIREASPGLRLTPLTTHKSIRVGARERLLDVQAKRPDRLQIKLNALVTKVLLDAQKRAVGVEYLEGERLYSAHANAAPDPEATGVLRQVKASREVILAGGAFNTPQLLMLSGIGDPAHLKDHRIEVKKALPGVGTNMQDRYEVAVINRMKFPTWESLDGAAYNTTDEQYKEWSTKKEGVYTSNGAIASVVAPSGPGKPVPDLFLYAVIGKFAGYVPGYSKDLPANPNVLSWVVLKGHTNNRAGTVTLRSRRAWDRPEINFRYFEEGSDTAGADLDAVVSGIRLARTLAANLRKSGLIKEEEAPGAAVESDDDLKQYVRDRAWGHHASCTCRIGDEAHGGVLTSDFKVHGIEGLRVVDASVFPRIPGYFIASAIYMIGEKAAAVIASQARGNP